MGAQFEVNRAYADRANLVLVHDDFKREALYDHGHAGYTGTIAESPGLTIEDQEFPTEDAAREWLEENARKWENTLAVHVQAPDGPGGSYWLFGGIYSD